MLNERGRELAALPSARQPPVVKLLKKFCKSLKQEDVKFAERFKFFGKWANFEDCAHKVGGMAGTIVRTYNGKFVSQPTQHAFTPVHRYMFRLSLIHI